MNAAPALAEEKYPFDKEEALNRLDRVIVRSPQKRADAREWRYFVKRYWGNFTEREMNQFLKFSTDAGVGPEPKGK